MTIRFLVLLFVISLASCAMQSDIEKIDSSMLRLERSISKLQGEIDGLLVNQQSLNKDMKSLHRESESELSSLKRSVTGIKSKTDQFEVDTNSNTLRFYPSDGTYRGY